MPNNGHVEKLDYIERSVNSDNVLLNNMAHKDFYYGNIL